MSQAILQIPAAPSGLDMRTQINQIFLAIITSHSGPSAPNPTYPGMWWGDTSAGRLRRRNNANNAWIDIGPLDDVLGDLRAQVSAGSVPVGTVLEFAASTPPSGYLLCNGSAVSRTTYAALFSLISTTFGAGDGSTTFNLPDRRGVTARGVDSGRGLDAGRVLGSYQADAFGSHSHGVNDPGHNHGVNDYGHGHAVNDPGHRHASNVSEEYIGPNGEAAAWTSIRQYSTGGAAHNNYGSSNGTGIGIYGNTTGISLSASGTGISIQSSGAAETRMKNIAMNYIIKT